MTTVRTLGSTAPPTPRANDMTRVRPPGMEMPSPRGSSPNLASPSSARVSVPSPGEINRQVRRKKSGLVALYWAAGIVAMLTAGGIVTAMIARGDADALIQRNQAPAVVQQPAAAPSAAAIAPATTATASAEADTAAKAAPAAPASSVAKRGNAAIPGTKPGQIVDLQLWRGRSGAAPGSAETAPANTGANAPTAAAAPKPTAAAPTPPSNGGSRPAVATPDNDPAVRLARDQLESTFK